MKAKVNKEEKIEFTQRFIEMQDEIDASLKNMIKVVEQEEKLVKVLENQKEEDFTEFVEDLKNTINELKEKYKTLLERYKNLQIINQIIKDNNIGDKNIVDVFKTLLIALGLEK